MTVDDGWSLWPEDFARAARRVELDGADELGAWLDRYGPIERDPIARMHPLVPSWQRHLDSAWAWYGDHSDGEWAITARVSPRYL